MPHSYSQPSLRNTLSMGTLSPESITVSLTASVTTFATSTAWPIASGTICVPIEVLYPVTVAKMMVNNGSVPTGTMDVGIYDAGGARLVSAGSTPQVGASAIQIFDIADTLLLPGLYYLALAFNNSISTVAGFGGVLVDMSPMGIYQQLSAFPLPATLTFSALNGTFVPLISMTPSTTI